MIQVTKTYNFNISNDATITYVVTVDNACIVVDNPTGTIDDTGVLVLTYTLSDSNCFGTATITATESVCNKQYTFISSIDSPCGSMSVNIQEADTTFTALVTGGQAPYSYTWSYPTNIFNEISNGDDGILVLEYGESVVDSEIRVFVTDVNGCSTNTTITHNVPNILVEDIVLNTTCAPVQGDTNSPFPVITNNFEIIAVTGNELDLSTVDFNLPNSNWLIVQSGTRFNFLITNNIDVGTYTIPYSVKDVNGLMASANIIVNYTKCNVDNTTFTVSDYSYSYSSTFAINDTNIHVPISTNAYDIRTLVWMPIGTQTSNTLTITGQYGEVTLLANNTLQHTITNATTNVAETFKAQLTDIFGNTDTFTLTYIYPDTTPQAVLNNDEVCLTGNVETIDVFANDTGNINQSTFQILSISSNLLQFSSNGQGTLTFPVIDYGTNTFSIQYQAQDNLGNILAPATITVVSLPSGSTDLGIINATTIDLSGFNITAQDAGNPATLDLISNPTAINIPVDGEYTLFEDFTSGSCTSQRTVTFTAVNTIIATSNTLIDTDATQDGRFDINLTASCNNAELSNGQEIQVRVLDGTSQLASATLLVGNSLTSVQSDVNWTTNIAPYFDTTTLNAATLLTGQDLVFRKRNWAIANGYAGVGQGIDLTFEFEFTKQGIDSGTASTTLTRVYEGQYYGVEVGTSSQSGVYSICQAEGSTSSKSGALFSKTLFDENTLQIFDGTNWVNDNGYSMANPVNNNFFTDHPTNPDLWRVCLNDSSANESIGIRVTTINNPDAIASIEGVVLTSKGIASDVVTITSRTQLSNFVQASSNFIVDVNENFFHLHNISNTVSGEPNVSDDCPINMTDAIIYIANSAGLSQDPKTGTTIISQVPPDARFDSSATIVSNVGNVYENTSQHVFANEGVYRVRSEFIRGNNYNCPSGDCNNIDWNIVNGNCSGDAGTGADINPNEPTAYQDGLYVIGSY